jgi:hypothetical protein
MKLFYGLLLFAVLTVTVNAQPRWYVNQQVGNDDFQLAAFNDPARPFKTLEFVVATTVAQGQTMAFITTQGGVWSPFDIQGLVVTIQADESVFVTPFIDSTQTRTAGLTLLGAAVIHLQPNALLGMKNFTCVDTNFQLAYPIDVIDAWWTSTRSTYIYNIFLPLSFGFNETAPPMTNLVIGRQNTTIEFVRDVFLFYDGFVADPENGVTLFSTMGTGNIATDATVWGWEFGYKLPTKRAIVAESWGALSDCEPSVIQSCGQQRHTNFVLSWNLDTNDIDEIIYSKGHDASIQFHGASSRRLDRLLAVKTKHILHQVAGHSIVTAINFDVSGQLEIDWHSNPNLDLQVAVTQSKGSLRLAGSLSTSVRGVAACGLTVAQAYSDDSTLIVNNCGSDSILELTADSSQQGHEMTVYKKGLGKLKLVAAPGTKIDGDATWSMGFLIKTIRLQFHQGEWYILSRL